MRKQFLALLILLPMITHAQEINIIPKPSFVKREQGSFPITTFTKIVLKSESNNKSAAFLNQYLRQFYGFQLPVVTNKGNVWKNAIILSCEKSGTHAIAGAYKMGIKKDNIIIEGKDDNGVFYAIQSLIQLLPFEKTKILSVPQLEIIDSARFAYRGMHLDVGRHFFPVEYIKKYIDYIAMYKMNTFHWHLTEDQGWRIEIKKYPELTRVGGYRNGTIIGRYPGKGNDSIRYGGFYTQEQIKEVVKYAADRYITIIPEIEMPGHSSAALTAYPELGCTGGPYKVQGTWGVFDDVYCAGNDYTFRFLEDVLDEVMLLFPSKYIHIGGDECPKASWVKCPKCQQRMKDNNLKDEHELQSYFIQRIEKYINSKGRQIIGWDEILEGGLAPNASVMSWRGEEGGIAAAKQKHQVIMTPGTYCYFDHSQTKNEDSITIGGFLPIEQVYSYEPIPAALTDSEAKYVLGAQANVWTEYIGNEKKLEYMIFPRMSALSEVLWSSKQNRNWNDFQGRLQNEFKRYDWWNVNYSKASFILKSAMVKSKK
jgi:hexosaminidase